jgi:hypothetical protein
MECIMTVASVVIWAVVIPLLILLLTLLLLIGIRDMWKELRGIKK